jgi:HPt (histidine-containing phosphotransfer) domain-containing protein
MGVIDTTTFAQLCETTDAGFVRELVQTFLDDAPQLLATLRSSASSGDATAFRRAAHSLKSNCDTFGAMHLAMLARDLESRGLDAATRLGEVEQAYASAAAELKGLAHG